MSKKKTPRTAKAATPTRTPHRDLAAEASDWDHRSRRPSGFRDAPDAVPRGHEAIAISIRMPEALLALLKRFAEREGIGYQVLIKRWLDDRLRLERERLRGAGASSSTSQSRAPQFPLEDRAGESGHYQH
jgi:hypothetical protein